MLLRWGLHSSSTRVRRLFALARDCQSAGSMHVAAVFARGSAWVRLCFYSASARLEPPSVAELHRVSQRGTEAAQGLGGRIAAPGETADESATLRGGRRLRGNAVGVCIVYTANIHSRWILIKVRYFIPIVISC